MDTLLRTIHHAGPAMKTFIRTKHTGNLGAPTQFKNVFGTGFQAKLATRAERVVNPNRHNRSSP
jgi:hypothetical protein